MTTSRLHSVAEAMDDLVAVWVKMNEKGEPADDDAAGWKEDFQEMFTSLGHVIDTLR